MTVSAVVNKIAYPGPGGTVFAANFPIVSASDVEVYKTDQATGLVVGSALVNGTDYTVTGVGGTGFTVTLTADLGAYGLLIRRVEALTMGTNLPDEGNLRASSIQAALDKLARLAQQLQEQLSRSLHHPITNAGTANEIPEQTSDGTILGKVGGAWVWLAAATAQLAADLLSTAVGKGAALVAYLAPRTGAVATTQQKVNERVVHLLDFMTDAQRTDWLTGAGLIDSTAAINAATAYAFSLSLGTLHAPWADTWQLGGVVVQLPPGKGLISGTVNWYDNVVLRGAGKRSTMIYSSYDGVLFTNVNTQYGCYQGGVSALSIMGDRTKANQIGLKLTRQWFGTFDDLEVYGCGNDGVQLFECLQVCMRDLETLYNVGNGLYVSYGLTAGNYPTNNCQWINGHFGFNDGAGIKSVGQVNGCQWIGGSAEGNYASGGNNVGYNIEWTSTDILMSEFVDMWVEGPCKAHVRVAIPNSGNGVRFTRLHHASNGAAGYVDRAVIVESGICYLTGAHGTGSLYKTISGSSVPFRIYKTGIGGILYARDCWGSMVQGPYACEDEANLNTGLTGRYWFDNQKYSAGTKTMWADSGQVTLSAEVTNESYAWWQLDNFYRGMSFGSGAAAPDARIKRSAANTLAMDTGDFFDQGSAWNGNHVLMGAYHLWIDATGRLRIKSGAPASDTDGTVVGTQT